MLITGRNSSRLFGVLAALALLAMPASAGAAKKKQTPKRPTINIVNPKQNALANRGVLKVKIRSHRKGKLRVRALSAVFDGNHVMKPLTRVAWPKFRRPGQERIVTLRLTPTGRKQSATCQDRDMQVKAGKFLSRRKAMVRQSPDCRPPTLDMSRSAHCNFIAAQSPAICMSPFPDNYYTLADARTESGRRINFTQQAMPRNVGGTPIDPGPYRASDGFSQGQTISVRVPGLDNPAALQRTNPVGLADPSRYLLPNAPVVVINALTRERHPVWVEIDSNASTSEATQLLIRPLVNFDPATRYIVALRHLKDAAGSVLTAPPGFRYYRDFLPTGNNRIRGRFSLYEDIFRRLRAAGIRRSNLYLAWDFTTASDENNSARALSMRDQAFAGLGDTDLADRRVQGDAPSFEVTSVTVDPAAAIARRVEGTFEVPCFLRHPASASQCQTGATMNLDADGVPRVNGTWDANFECIVPDAIVDPGSVDPEELPPLNLRGRAVVYGHGLMGSIGGEIQAQSQRLLAARGFTICGTDEIGMSTADLVTVSGALGNLSNFPKVADRLQQGLLNEMFLARLMIHPEGLVSRAAFRFDPSAPDPAPVPVGDGDASVPPGSPLAPVLETGPQTRAWYRGISQGGIMGGALMALSPDFDRGALGVGAMNYSVLLTRSRSWDNYSSIFNPAYPNQVERPLALSLAQMLWDRGEPNGYAHRMTDDPLPETPSHQVLMDTAFGDHLVTNWQTNVQARTIGARAVAPLLAEGRWPGVDWAWGLAPITAFPFEGSAVAYWDSGPLRPGPGPDGQVGTDPPPITNTAPSAGEDPHEHPRVTESAIEMIDDFLRAEGRITDPCAPGPCLAGGWTGP